MSKFLIHGGKKVFGDVKISGSKNSVLPILSACIITNSVVTLKNCPYLSDVKVSVEILKSLGCKINVYDDIIEIDSREIYNNEVSESLSIKMRSSIFFLSSILSRKKQVCIYLPGGCNLGKRPIDLHIDALEKMGVDFSINGNKIVGKVNKEIDCVEINFKVKSVGATENAIIYSCISKGKTIINNASKEPEIVDLVNFLNSCGANIKGVGSDTIEVQGVDKLHGCEYLIMPDRIETITYMGLVACCGGEVNLHSIDSSTIDDGITYFKKSGCSIKIDGDILNIKCNERPKPIKYLKTAPYPSFSTDAQPIFVAVMSLSYGKTVFWETIFENRYKYIDEMHKFNVDIKVNGQYAFVNGKEDLTCAKVKATDLRGGAALVLLACAINGESEISDIYHIDRGYSYFLEKLNDLGVDIRKVS